MEYKSSESMLAGIKESRFEDFEPWFLDIVDDTQPSMIISVARGAVRFMQLHLSRERQNAVRHLSHHAIPFLDMEELHDKRVLVFDDSVIFGSTMSSVKKRLERRGSHVICTSYVLDRTHFLGEVPPRSRRAATPSPYMTLPLISRHHLWPDDVKRHHAQLVGAILHTGLHYNLDFPTFRITLGECSVEDGPYIHRLLEGISCFRSVADVSDPFAMECSIPRYAAILEEQSWDWLACDSLAFRPYGKVRITYAPRENALFLTPILQLAMRDDASFDEIAFANPEANRLWHMLKGPQCMTDNSSYRALFRLATAFAGIAVGVPACSVLVAATENDFDVLSTSLEPFDMRVVLGEENAEALSRMWEHLRAEPPIVLRGIRENSYRIAESPNAPVLRAQIQDAFRRRPSLTPDKRDPISEAVGKVLLALRTVTDNTVVRRVNPSADRLNTGLTYEGIRTVLFENTGWQPGEDELSLCIDYCVDHGLAVPKVVQEEGRWFRAFYCGENEDNQATLQFKGALHAAYQSYMAKKNSEYLSPFDLQKLCVALKDVLSWLPISTGPNRYGYTSKVGDQQLIGWLTQGHRPPFRETREGNRRIVVPTPDYQPLVPCIWEAERMRDFSDAFDYTACAFRKIPDEAKLLLTTCRTHRHAFNAIAFEVWGWSDYREPSFGSFLDGIVRTMAEQEPPGIEVLRSLYWSIRYVSEAWKKYRIFQKDYAKLKKKLERAFCSIGPSGQRWWSYLCAKDIFDDTPDPRTEKRLQSLLPLLKQITRLTSYTIKLLAESSVVPEQTLEEAFQREGSSLQFPEFAWVAKSSRLKVGQEYNNAVLGGRLPGKSVFEELVPVENETELSRTQASMSIQGVLACLGEVRQAIRKFCPKYKVREGDFPFSPNSNRRVLTDGRTERDLQNVFILTLDIIKGTNSLQTNEMKTQIREVLGDSGEKKLVFEDTGNDAFIACCHDVRVLWDAAQAIRIRGEDLKVEGDPLGGTRKGLYFGSVIAETKNNGETLLHDLPGVNVIPAAFSMLGGIDKHVDANKRNDALIIRKREFARIADTLDLDMSAAIQVHVKEKHFDGPACIVHLP